MNFEKLVKTIAKYPYIEIKDSLFGGLRIEEKDKYVVFSCDSMEYTFYGDGQFYVKENADTYAVPVLVSFINDVNRNKKFIKVLKLLEIIK